LVKLYKIGGWLTDFNKFPETYSQYLLFSLLATQNDPYMKRVSFSILLLLQVYVVFSQTQEAVNIIPEPVSMTRTTGSFSITAATGINAGTNADARKVADWLAKQLSVATGFTPATNSQSAAIQLVLNPKADAGLGKEGYQLTVTTSGVIIKANQPAGLFYGAQTFLQLLPKEIDSKTAVKNMTWQAPCVNITDYPRFGWRGLMFDVSRHFFTKQQVKDFMDEMARYKMNLLHLHLTDDEGWRIEIKSLPKLTEVGAWRATRTGRFGDLPAPDSTEPRDYGGFFTQDDIRELVQYGKDHFINILPEVDIPGHSLATIASYPDLSCTPGADKYQVRSGEKIMDWHAGGFSALVDNTLCPANEKVYTFLDKVFTEVAKLFPFEYIHVGGDECAKNFWEQSDAVKALMKKEKLTTMEEVQSYFEKRVEKIVESKGKKVIGWDEILEGGLAPNAVVMSWRGIKGGIEAAKMGHEVVMSPTTFMYIDYMQGDKQTEAPVYATLRLKTTYSYEPIPDGVDPKFIKGAQANLWTEQVYNTRHLQYMVWPRALAVAETVWSPKDKKDWNRFTAKVEKSFERMDLRQVKYATTLYDPIIAVKKDAKDSILIALGTEAPGLDIYYSWDYSMPDNFYPKYKQLMPVPKGATMLKVVTYRDGKKMGRQIDLPLDELKRRADAKNLAPEEKALLQ
jgi:hexosaminidase